MKNTIKFIAIAMLVLAPLGGLAQPKLEVLGGSSIDFGDIDRGTVLEKIIKLRNVGDTTLVIQKVEASCGCTGTLVSQDRIQPGETGEVKITFKSGGFSGPVHKSITVVSNSAREERYPIAFTVNVVQEVVLSPGQILFRDAEVGNARTITLTLRNDGKEPFKLTGFTSSVEGLTLSLPEEPIEPGKSVEFAGVFKPTAVKQVLSDYVTIKTTSKKQPEVNLPVFGNVKEFKFQ